VQQLGFEGMPRRLVYVHAHQAEHLAGLPAPVPDELPGPAGTGQGPAVGAQQPRRERAQRAGRLVAAAPCRERTVPAAGGLLERGWIGEGYAELPAVCPVPGRGPGPWLRRTHGRSLIRPGEPVGVERTVATRTELDRGYRAESTGSMTGASPAAPETSW